MSLPFSPEFTFSRSLLQPGYPKNVTVAVGGEVKLICKVQKRLSAHVQWFKQDAGHLHADVHSHLRALAVSENFRDDPTFGFCSVSLSVIGIISVKAAISAGHQ